jgi:hypothetical protein
MIDKKLNKTTTAATKKGTDGVCYMENFLLFADLDAKQLLKCK